MKYVTFLCKNKNNNIYPLIKEIITHANMNYMILFNIRSSVVSLVCDFAREGFG